MAGSKCYFPNGTQGASWVHACDPDASASPCCAYGVPCLSNRLCRDTSRDDWTYRGLCTDPTWQSPECGLICAESPNGAAWVESCEYLTKRADDYCCSIYTEKSCCEDSTRRFKLQPPDSQTWAEWDDDENRYVLVGSVVEVSKAATSTLSSTALEEVTTFSVEETSTVAADRPESTDASTDTSSAGDGQLSTGARAGVGVGAGIGTILFFALIWLLTRCYKRRVINKEGQQQTSLPRRNLHGAELPAEFHGSQQPFSHHVDPSEFRQAQMQGIPGDFSHHRRSELSA
ncbi:hypothetical protein CC79DRAFT_1365747 [Sarocladium strictum]